MRGVYLTRVGPAVLVSCLDRLRDGEWAESGFADPDAWSLGVAGYGQDLIARLPS